MTPIIFIFLVCLFPLSLAHREYRARIPNGVLAGPNSVPGIQCNAIGHQQCAPGKARNQFGNDFEDEGEKWTKALCMMDSDGDGLTNGEELGDPCCVWAVGKKPSRSVNLSHPGKKEDTRARKAKKCGESATASVCGKSKAAIMKAKMAACFCYAVESGKVKPKASRAVVRMRCSKLFGGKGKMLAAGKKACGGCCMKRSKKSKKKMLETSKVMKKESVFNKCFKNMGK